MNNIRNMKYFKITYAVIINAVIMSLFLLLTNMNYEIADNQTYSLYIADGDYIIFYTNYFLCALCGLLQKLIYPINAYVIMQLVLCFTSFVAISRVFLDRFNLFISTGIILFLNGFFAVNHYETVSFTRNPALLCAAGFLLMIHYSRRDKWLSGTIFGGVLVLFGAMYRFYIFEVALVVAVVYVFALSLTEYFIEDNRKRKIKSIFSLVFERKRFLSCMIVVIGCFSVNFVSVAINNSTENLRYYNEYTMARSDVWDYAIPDYDQCKAEYDKIGINENDIEMLRNGYMDDEGAFSLEKLKAIKEIQSNYNKTEKSVFSVIKNMIVSEIGNIRGIGDKGMALLSFLFILFAMIFVCKKRVYFIPGLLIPVIFAFYSYLWISGKCPFRAVYVLWLCADVFMLYSFSFVDSRKWVQNLYIKKKRLFSGCIACLLVIASIFGLYVSRLANDSLKTNNGSFSDETSNMEEYIRENTDKKFEPARGIDVAIDTIVGNNVYSVKQTDLLDRYIGFNCTYYRSMQFQKSMEKFGTENMYRSLLDDNIYFIDETNGPQKDIMKKYLQKYYSEGKTVVYKIIDTVDDNEIVKFCLV